MRDEEMGRKRERERGRKERMGERKREWENGRRERKGEKSEKENVFTLCCGDDLRFLLDQ